MATMNHWVLAASAYAISVGVSDNHFDQTSNDSCQAKDLFQLDSPVSIFIKFIFS